MKNKLLFIFYITFLSFTAPAQSDLSISEEMALWSELAFKHTVIVAIDAAEKTNKALGFPKLDSSQRKTLAIPAAIGVGGITVLSTIGTVKTVKGFTSSISIDQKMLNYTKKYQNIINDIVELKVNVFLSTNFKEEIEAVTPKENSMVKKDINFNNEIAKKQKELEKLIRRKPGLLYRSGRALRGLGIGTAFLTGAGTIVFAFSDTVVIVTENEEDLQLIRGKYKEDCEVISELLDVSGGIF